MTTKPEGPRTMADIIADYLARHEAESAPDFQLRIFVLHSKQAQRILAGEPARPDPFPPQPRVRRRRQKRKGSHD